MAKPEEKGRTHFENTKAHPHAAPRPPKERHQPAIDPRTGRVHDRLRQRALAIPAVGIPRFIVSGIRLGLEPPLRPELARVCAPPTCVLVVPGDADVERRALWQLECRDRCSARVGGLDGMV